MFKIKIKQVPLDKEEQIIINCHEINAQVNEIVYKLQNSEMILLGSNNGEVFRIEVKTVYYIESIDNKTFIYTKDNVYETKLRLYEIEEKFSLTKLFRCSKSMILNLAKIKSVSPSINGRFEARLSNGEVAIISRQYVPALKKRLGM